MPVILPPQHWATWLDTGLQGVAELVPLLRQYPAEAMRAYRVSEYVNDARNEGPECLAAAG
jgi:putative SOS response-associated peptidase YedK